MIAGWVIGKLHMERFLENSAWQGAGNWFQKSAGIMIGILGLYFILTPLVS